MALGSQLVRSVSAAVDAPPPVTGKSVIDGEFTFDSCVDVHIGTKVEHNSSIVINQNISVSSEGELPPNYQTVLKEELKNSTYDAVKYKHYTKHCCFQFWPITIVVATMLSTVLTIIIILVLTTSLKENISSPSEKNNSENVRPPSTYLMMEDADDYPLVSGFVLRDTWGASPPRELFKNNTLPVKRVIFIHTVHSSTCNTFTACKEYVKTVQEMHIESFGDIGYNFIIGSDGYIYVGVGWGRVGAHTKGYNTGSLGVAFIGDFRKDEPNELMLQSAKELLKVGVEKKKLSETFQLFGHCQLHLSFPYSPGKNILKYIKTWDHWNSSNVNRCVGFH